MNNKEISLGALLSFVSQIINIIVGLVFTPVMVRILGQNEYGLYQLVLSTVNYLNLMNLGFNGAYIRYYSLAKTKNEKEISKINGMFFTIFCVISFACLIVGFFLYQNIHILGTHLTDAEYVIAKRLMVLMVVNLAVSFPNSLFVAYMFANERFIFFRVIIIITSIVLPIIKIPLLLFGYGSIGIVSATLLMTILQFVLNTLYCKYRLKMKIEYGYFDRSVFNDLLRFTFFVFLSDLVDQLNTNVDKLLLGRIMGTVAVALYSIAYSLKGYYTTMTWILPEVYVPEVNRAIVEQKSMEKANTLFLKIGRINNFLTLLVISGFLIFGYDFIRLWVGEEYQISYYAALILMISGYIPAVQTLGTNIQNAKNMHQLRSIVYFGVACINVISSIWLIRFWGVIGTCIGTLFASLIGHGLFMNIYYHKRIDLNIPAFWKEIVSWYPYVAAITIGALMIMKNIVIKGWVDLALGIVAYTCIYAVLGMIFGLKKDERRFIFSKLRSFRKA